MHLTRRLLVFQILVKMLLTRPCACHSSASSQSPYSFFLSRQVSCLTYKTEASFFPSRYYGLSRALSLYGSSSSNNGCKQVSAASHHSESQHTSMDSESKLDQSQPLHALKQKEWWVFKLIEQLSTAFPIWVAMAYFAALKRPQTFLWFQGRWQIAGLILTMLGMGMTLSLDDFKGALAMPRELLAGVVLQYTVMPSAGALIAKFLGLPSPYAAGLVLVSCCPGGTASNVVTYLARGNVALSVLMTSTSTILAVVMTPLLTAKLAGRYVAVNAAALLISTLQVVLLPVFTGALMAQYLPNLVAKISPFSPLVAIVTVAALCGSAIAQNAGAILSSGGQLVIAVSSLHMAGFLFGYLLSLCFGFDESVSRTISIEVGMQNSVLGVLLANQHFSNPLTAVPCAISSVLHSIIGSLLAALWRLFPKTESTEIGRTNVS